MYAETIIVWLIVAGAAVYLFRTALKIFSGKTGCACDCRQCPVKTKSVPKKDGEE